MFLDLCKWVLLPSEARGIGAPGLESTGGCELPNMGARNQTQAFWKSRMHSTMEPSFPSWFCSIFSVYSMYNMCGVCECMYPCTHMEKPEEDSKNWVSLWTGKLTTMARLAGWLGELWAVTDMPASLCGWGLALRSCSQSKYSYPLGSSLAPEEF